MRSEHHRHRIFSGRAHYLAGNNVDALVALEHSALERDMVRWRPPPSVVVDMATALYRAVLHPVFCGLERVPRDERQQHTVQRNCGMIHVRVQASAVCQQSYHHGI